jgi:hypothetical protein
VRVGTQATHAGCNGALGHPDVPKGQRLGSRKERKGEGEHATYLVLFASSMRNTGDSSGEVKSSGEGVRGKRLTKVRGHRGESEGAEEAEHGKAVHTGTCPQGEGP